MQTPSLLLLAYPAEDSLFLWKLMISGHVQRSLIQLQGIQAQSPETMERKEQTQDKEVTRYNQMMLPFISLVKQ